MTGTIDVLGTESVGAIAGQPYASVFHNVSVRGSGPGVRGDSWVGGIVGEDGHSFSDCHAEVDVEATAGLAGGITSEGSNFNFCSFHGSVSSTDDTGGIAGVHFDGISSNLKVSGTVSSNTNDVGGLFGVISGYVMDSYSSANVSGLARVGGLIGRLNAGLIVRSFAVGTVTGNHTSTQVGPAIGQDVAGDSTGKLLLGWCRLHQRRIGSGL